MTEYDALGLSPQTMLVFKPVTAKPPGESPADKSDKKQISVRLDWTVYDGRFAAFKREYGFTDLSAGEILILYALPRCYEAVEEYTRERRRASASGAAVPEHLTES